jgi:glycosyltransferase involved in cell wall biosynthesis
MMPFFQEVENVSVKQYMPIETLLGRYLIGMSHVSVKKIPFLIISILYTICSIPSQISFIRSEAPDLIHLNSSILWAAGIAGKLAKVPIVWHIREASSVPKYNLVKKLYIAWIKKVSAKVVCIGPQEYRQMGGSRSGNIVMIHNSLDNTYFFNSQDKTEKLRQEINLPLGKFVYLSLGGNSFRNGPYQLIGALNYLKDAACVIAGQPPAILNSKPRIITRYILKIEDWLFQKGFRSYFTWQYRHRLSNALKEASLDRLFLPGYLKDVKPYILSCDVLVFPGTCPHSARPIYEAWALKKPVIGFDSEVMRMDIEDGVDGVIVKEHTAEALAKALSYLEKHPDICKQMGEAGYQKALNRFSLKQNTLKLLDVYKSIT